MNILVNDGGKIYTIEAGPHTQLKYIIGNHACYCNSQIYNGNQCIEELGQNAIMHIIHSIRGGEYTVQIRTLNGKTFSIKVESTQKVELLLTDISKHLNIDALSLDLYFKGVKLDSDKTIESYGIDTNSMLHLIVNMDFHQEKKVEKSKEEYISVHVSYGKNKVTVEVPNNDSTTMEAIQQKATGMIDLGVNMYFNGKPCRKEDKLSELGISNDSIIVSLRNNKGGS